MVGVLLGVEIIVGVASSTGYDVGVISKLNTSSNEQAVKAKVRKSA